MPYEYLVEPKNPLNTHHLLLRKGADQMGIILCDAAGKRDKTNIQRQPYPRSALKFYQGEEDYADSEPPFRPIAQSDFSGGRGLLTFETDTRRFQDSYRCDTRHAGKVFLGPLETYGTGDHSVVYQAMPGNVRWLGLYGSNIYFARSFVSGAGATTVANGAVILKAVGAAPDLRFELWSNAANTPTAILGADNYFTVDDAGMYEVNVSEMVAEALTLFAALGIATTYWIVIRATGTPDGANHWEVAYDSTVTGKMSANGAAWSDYAGAPYFRLTGTTAVLHGRTFDYKGGRYMVSHPDSGNSKLFINGTRGVADSNAGQLTRLNDATKAAATDWHCAAGAKVVIVKGPGSEEAQPWRTVTSVNIGWLGVDTAWITTHTTDTEYVITNSDEWDELADLGGLVTDFASTDEFIYFARGETAGLNVLRYQAYNSAGAWTARTEAEDEPALYLAATRDPNLGAILWGARNDHPLHGVSVWKGRVPPAWGKLYTVLKELAPTDEPWDSIERANITQSTEDGATKTSVDAAFTTGNISSEDLDDPVDITQGKSLGVLAYSSIALAGTDMDLLYDELYGQALSPVAVQHYNASGPAYTSLSLAKDGDLATKNDVTLQAADYIYIGGAAEFFEILVNLGATVNLVAATLTVQYFNGFRWTAVDNQVDGTDLAGATFGQDGTISYDVLVGNWAQCTVNSITAFWVRLKFSVDLTANIGIEEFDTRLQNRVTLSFPAHAAGEWQWDTLAITPTQNPLPNATRIKNLWITLAANKDAFVWKMHGGVQVLAEEITHIKLPNDARINGMWAYAGSEATPRRYPWVFTEKEFGEIQWDSVAGIDLWVPVALDELAALKSVLNGKAHAVHNRYLWFSMGERIERYQNEQLEDVGPTLDEGLPENRRGNCVKLLSYPGQMLAAFDAGASGYSSILSYTGGGWHEVYRAPKGQRIWDIDTQSIEGDADRLWVCQGDDVLWLPIDLNPLTNADYSYTWESVLYSCRVWGGMQDVLKFWKSLKLVSQDLASGQVVYGDYKIEGEATWHTLPAAFDTSMFQEILLTYAYDQSGRYIELRLRSLTNDATKTPVILGTVIESLMRFEVKFVWSINFRLASNDLDLAGNPDPLGYSEKLALLDEWLLSPTPLEVSCFREDTHGAIAFLEPVPMRPLHTEVDPEYPDGSRLVDVAQLTIIQI
jgi:hypothetical protein